MDMDICNSGEIMVLKYLFKNKKWKAGMERIGKHVRTEKCK